MNNGLISLLHRGSSLVAKGVSKSGSQNSNCGTNLKRMLKGTATGSSEMPIYPTGGKRAMMLS